MHDFVCLKIKMHVVAWTLVFFIWHKKVSLSRYKYTYEISTSLLAEINSNTNWQSLNAFYAFYGVNPVGLNPMTCVSLYQKIVIPTIPYGSEVGNNMSISELDQIHRTRCRIIRNIQGFPLKTRTDICESMLGLHPLSVESVKRKLMFLHKVTLQETWLEFL